MECQQTLNVAVHLGVEISNCEITVIGNIEDWKHAQTDVGSPKLEIGTA